MPEPVASQQVSTQDPPQLSKQDPQPDSRQDLPKKSELDPNQDSQQVALQDAAPVQAKDPKPKVDLSKYNLGLEGYCSVTLMEQQKWVKGDSQWGCMHRGRLYLFKSREYRDQFQMSPDMYSPLLGGADPVEFHIAGKLVDGKRKHGVFYGEEDGPTVIVLFSTPENRDKFEASPAEYLRTVRQAMSRIDSDLLLR